MYKKRLSQKEITNFPTDSQTGATQNPSCSFRPTKSKVQTPTSVSASSANHTTDGSKQPGHWL